MSQSNILLVGAGGHAVSCIDVLEAQAEFEIYGLIGKPDEVGETQLGYTIVGSDNDLVGLLETCSNALVCIGQVKSPEARMRLFTQLRQLGYRLPSIISPMAWVSPRAHIGAGSIVMHGAIVNAGASVGENCIINSRALIEHNTKVSDHCHISTGALLNGDVVVGEGSFIGSGSQVKEGVHIGRRCMVGMGASVFSDLADEQILKQAK